MPAGKGKEADTSNAPQARTTFRPPWVKEGPNPLPLPTTPWVSKNPRRDSNTSDAKPDNPLANVQLRKTSIPNKELQENGSKESTFVKPSLKPVPPKPDAAPGKQKEEKFTVKLNSVAERIKKEPPRPNLRRDPTVEQELDREVPSYRNQLVREESILRVNLTPVPPPMPPPPPPPSVPPDFIRDSLSRKQLEHLENLRTRPKTRPDWTNLLKEIEDKKRLKHVHCNDRSQPVLPESKAKEHFLYESEKATAHNVLLKQIQQGISLKRVKTNDRSKPQLEGLRKFRRQMTIEEQIQKSVSMATIPPEEIADEADEMDDIDRVRDDLQSTKQMLAFELRNKEAQIRENKRLIAKLQAMEAELEKERNANREGGGGGIDESSEKKMKSLQTEADKARKTYQEVEKKYHDASDQLENTKAELDDMKKQKEELEKRLQDTLQGKRGSFVDKKENLANGNESGEEFEESETSEDSEEGDDEEKMEKRLQKQMKQFKTKLRNYKNKEDNAKKERVALREIIKKNQTAMKEEKKKYKVLQKEVNKMAALMKDVGSDEEEEDEEAEDKEESEEESEEESSEESESGGSEDDSASERSQSEPEEASTVNKKDNYATRSTRHENILAAIKKGNYMLKTNAERLQDDLNKQKELTAALQEDLDSVLSELG